MRILLYLGTLTVLAITIRAQEPVAPTSEPVGNPRGAEYGGYNISNSFEAGGRFLDLNGNQANYQAAVNYGNGLRLFSSSLSIFSRTGENKLFDSIVLTTQGLGGDPYETINLRVKQHKFYTYVAAWRDSDYVNPGLVTGGGEGSNALSTSYASQSHDLVLLPESHVRWLLGYRRDSQSGLGLTTELVPNASTDLFPVLSQIRRVRNEYQLGVELHWRNSMVKLLRGWSDFKDDSPYLLPISGIGAVTDFSRAAPSHATNPSWTLLFLERDKRADISGSFTYANGEGSFVSDESIFGGGFLGTPVQQIQTSGVGRQPVATGNLNIDFDVTNGLTLTSHTSFYDGRTEGTNSYFEQEPGQVSQVLYFQSLDIRTVTTDLQADQRVNKWLDVFGGYEYSNRLINSVEQLTISDTLFRFPYAQTNEENDGFFGLKIQAMKSLTASLEGEISHSSLPFTPKSDGNYVAWKASLTYRARDLQLSASAQDERNATSTSLTSFSSHNQTLSAAASWNARPWLNFDGSYSNIYTNVLGGLAFFAGGLPVDNAFSYYVMNLHAANGGVRMQVGKSVSLYLGGTVVRDSGDGRHQADVSPYDPTLEAFRAAQTFPLSYVSPFARLSVRLNQFTRWNLGYQLYKYEADFSPALNFTANTGFTSLSWSF